MRWLKWNTVTRSLMLCMTGVLLLLFFVLLPAHRARTVSGPERRLIELQLSLKSVVLASDSIANSDQQEAAYYEVTYTKLNNLYQSLQDLEKDARDANQDIKLANTIPALTKSLQNAAIQTGGRLSVLAKPLSYSPQNDLGRLSLEDNTAELIIRADAAHTALQKLAESNFFTAKPLANSKIKASTEQIALPNDTRSKLQAMSNCFGQLEQQLKSKNYIDAKSTRDRCSSQYPDLRTSLIDFVSAGFNSKDGRATIETARQKLKETNLALDKL